MAQGRRGILRNPKCRNRVRRQGLDIPASRRACERPHEVAMNGSGRAGEAGLRDMRFVPVFQFAGQDCGGFGMRGIACSGRFWPFRGRRGLLGTGTFGVGGNLFHDSSTQRGPRSPATRFGLLVKVPNCNDLRVFHPMKVKHPLLSLLSQALATGPRDRIQNLSRSISSRNHRSASFSAVSTKCRRAC